MRNRFATTARRIAALGALVWMTTAIGAPTEQVSQLLDADRFSQAATESAAFLEDHPDAPRMRFLHALALVQLDRTDQAEAIFKALAEAHPGWPGPPNNLAVLHARRGNYESARDWLEKALKSRPAYATAYANLSEVYAALAAASYRKALDGEARNDDAPVNLALVPAGQGGPSPRTEGLLADNAPEPDESPTPAPGESAPATPAPEAETTQTAATDDSAGAPAAGQNPADSETTDGDDQTTPDEPATRIVSASGVDQAETDSQQDGGDDGVKNADGSEISASAPPGNAESGDRTRSGKGAPSDPPGAAEPGSADRKSSQREAPTRGEPAERVPEPTAEAAPEAGDGPADGSSRTDTETAARTDEPPSRQEAARSLVERWRRAWSQQNVSAYFATYASNYLPDADRTLAQWRDRRRERVSAPTSIEVGIRDIDVRSLAENRLRVSFVQSYRSDNYSDRVSKTLILAKQDGGWRILRETARPQP